MRMKFLLSGALTTWFEGSIAVVVVSMGLECFVLDTVLRGFAFLCEWILLINFKFILVLVTNSRALTSFLRLQCWSLERGVPTWVRCNTLLELRFVLCKRRLFYAGRSSAGLSFGGTATAHNVFKTLSVQYVIVFNWWVGSSLVGEWI